jgi:hypothetical protein
MAEPTIQRSAAARAGRHDRFGVWQLLLLLTGVSIALAVSRPFLLAPHETGQGDPIVVLPVFVRVIIAVLGGFSFMGVPLLLTRLTRRRTPWGPGQVTWFSQGVATWLLWPPIVYWQTAKPRGEMPWSAVCWLWGTPLIGLYMTAALLVGGWFGRRGRRRAKRSWREQFGLLLSCLWACTGLYLLSLLYWIDIFRRR